MVDKCGGNQYFLHFTTHMLRPELNEQLSPADFKNHYWLKRELIAFCRSKSIPTSGGKLEITSRIVEYLKNGLIIKPAAVPRKLANFNWQTSPLNLNTIITDNYQNTAQVRAFFEAQIGPHFRINVAFLAWMKDNVGKTLADAIVQWHLIIKQKKEQIQPTKIGPQFEYNKYIRDFLADNADKTLKEAIHFWKLKRNQAGAKHYHRKDLDLH